MNPPPPRVRLGVGYGVVATLADVRPVPGGGWEGRCVWEETEHRYGRRPVSRARERWIEAGLIHRLEGEDYGTVPAEIWHQGA